MTHDDYQEQISQLIDGELGEQSEPALFAHLSTCGDCRSFLNSALTLRSKLATISSPIPQGLDDQMRMTFVATPIDRFNAQPAAFRLALAASIAFLLLMGSLLLGPQLYKSQPSVVEEQGIVFPQQN